MNRRHCMRVLGSAAVAKGIAAPAPSAITHAYVKSSAVRVRPVSAGVDVIRAWSGSYCGSRLRNRGTQPVTVSEIVLFSIAHSLPGNTRLYGESFQMLSQTGGTLANPIDYGYSELKHYKIPQPADATVVTDLLTLTPPTGAAVVMAFTSCRRLNGRFYLRPGSVEVVLDTEGLVIAPGETWDLEEFGSSPEHLGRRCLMKLPAG